MKKLLKVILVLLAGCGVLMVAAVLLLPRLIDVDKYKGMIEQRAGETLGREVTLAGDLSVSLFPWVGLSFAEFRIGNPEGFPSGNLLSIQQFDAHLEVMPLLSKQVVVDRFVIEGPVINLHRLADGRANWEIGTGQSAGTMTDPEPEAGSSSGQPFKLESLEVGEFAIINGLVRVHDEQAGLQRQVQNVHLKLTDISFERPIKLELSGTSEEMSLAVNGVVGPIGSQPGKGELPLDISVMALDRVGVKLKGILRDPAGELGYDLQLDIDSFSPRELMGLFGMGEALPDGDPNSLTSLALSVHAVGGTSELQLQNGKLNIDDSTLDFQMQAADFDPVNLSLAAQLDTIDLDRYLPPASDASGEAGGDTGGQDGKDGGESPPVDYEPLRSLAVDIALGIGELKVKGGTVSDVKFNLTGKDGVFVLDDLSMQLYGGQYTLYSRVNVQGDQPVTQIKSTSSAINVGPLLKDFAKKEILEGTAQSDIQLSLTGDTPDAIKKSLNGTGELLFTDGAIVGIDLADMVRNASSAVGLMENVEEKPKTDFAELNLPFAIVNGNVDIPGASLKSPLIRVNVSGTADLVSEALDMKVNPKFVATLKGQGDETERSGLLIPILVGGTFQAPEFKPDLEALARQQLMENEKVKKLVEQELSEVKVKEIEEMVPEEIEKVVPGEPLETLQQGLKSFLPKF